MMCAMSVGNLVHLCTIVASLFPLAICISMSAQDYRRLVEARCFNETALREPLLLGQSTPVGLTVDYLVSLIEVAEQRLPSLTAKDIVALLLKRFHYDGTKHIGLQNVQSDNEISRALVNNLIFASVLQNFHTTLPEDVFTENEKCAMFFMLSHTVNVTKVPTSLVGFNEYSNDAYPISSLNNPYSYIKRELGAVSLSNSDRFAISIGRVLIAIAIGLYDVQSMPNNNSSANIVSSMEPLLVVTFADQLAIKSLKSIVNVDNLPMIGAEGVWNGTYCQTEYKLTTDGHQITLADINGAISGYLLGQKLLSEEGQYLKKLHLSTILKRFFSKDGLTSDCGICFSSFLSNELKDKIRENAIGYLYQFNNYFNKDKYDFEKLSGYVHYGAIQLGQFIEKAKSVQMDACFRESNFLFDPGQCETNTNLFLMIDNNIPLYWKFQQEFITKLLLKLNSANWLGSITILVNAYRGFTSDQARLQNVADDLKIPLHLLTYNTSSVQEATCRLAWYPFRETTINDKKVLINYLVKLFERHNTTDGTRARSKNFIWFSLKSQSYLPLTDRDKATYYWYRWYLKYYINLRTFFISTYDKKEDDELNQIMLNQDDWLQVKSENSYDVTMVDRLVKQICQTPIAVVYDQCHKSSSVGVEHQQLITPGRKQYWAIYPKYFLQSNTITLKFQAKGVKIRICLDRWMQPERFNARCKEAVTDGDFVEFQIDHPCRWKTIDTCLPIYFTVSITKHDLALPYECLDVDCKSLNQIKWSISHWGLICSNNVSSVQLQWTTLLLSFLLICLHMFTY